LHIAHCSQLSINEREEISLGLDKEDGNKGQVLQYNKVGKGNSFQYACQYRYAILVT